MLNPLVKVKEKGFTLIEVLIVIFIISIVTSVALLTMTSNENRQIESFTRELTQLMTLAEEHAMLQPAVLGLLLNKFYYYFASYQTSSHNKKPYWIPIDDKLLGQHVIPNDIALNVEGIAEKPEEKEETKERGSPAEKEKNLPRVIISTNGDITPFKIYVGKKGKAPRYVIEGDANGNVISKILS